MTRCFLWRSRLPESCQRVTSHCQHGCRNEWCRHGADVSQSSGGCRDSHESHSFSTRSCSRTPGCLLCCNFLRGFVFSIFCEIKYRSLSVIGIVFFLHAAGDTAPQNTYLLILIGSCWDRCIKFLQACLVRSSSDLTCFVEAVHRPLQAC